MLAFTGLILPLLCFFVSGVMIEEVGVDTKLSQLELNLLKSTGPICDTESSSKIKLDEESSKAFLLRVGLGENGSSLYSFLAVSGTLSMFCFTNCVLSSLLVNGTASCFVWELFFRTFLVW